MPLWKFKMNNRIFFHIKLLRPSPLKYEISCGYLQDFFYLRSSVEWQTYGIINLQINIYLGHRLKRQMIFASRGIRKYANFPNGNTPLIIQK